MKSQIISVIILIAIVLKVYKFVNIDIFTLALISLISLIIFYDNPFIFIFEKFKS